MQFTGRVFDPLQNYGGEMSDFLQMGKRGEALAWNYLRKQGYFLLEKNFRTRFGEIDIIARKQGVVVFIEIKTRRDTSFGFPEEAVDARKQAKMIRCAQAYLQARGMEERPVRFDVLSVLWDGKHEPQFSLLEDTIMIEA